jgi:branched-chain amino acid transport system ATP-binding protein
LAGREISGRSPFAIYRCGLARSFQITNIFPRLSVYENISCAVLWSRKRGYAFWRFVDALEIGITIAGEPRTILLDEPTAGMSRIETEQAIALIRRVSRNRTLLMIEHDMSVVFGLADRISVLVYGQVIATGDPASIKSDSAVRAAYLGTEA